MKAAEASRCAGEQGKYWEIHNQLFANYTALDLADLFRYSQAIGLDFQKFQQCLESGKYVNEIRKDILEGQKSGVRGTPTFFIGISNQDASKVEVLKVIRGAQPFTNFKETLDSLLASQK